MLQSTENIAMQQLETTPTQRACFDEIDLTLLTVNALILLAATASVITSLSPELTPINHPGQDNQPPTRGINAQLNPLGKMAFSSTLLFTGCLDCEQPTASARVIAGTTLLPRSRYESFNAAVLVPRENPASFTVYRQRK